MAVPEPLIPAEGVVHVGAPDPDDVRTWPEEPELLFGIRAPLNLILPVTSNFWAGLSVPIPTLPSFFIIILVSDKP